MPNYYIAVLCLLATTYFTSSAQEVQSVRLTQYTQKEGLSSDYVTKIIRDKYGFIWTGTQEGLNVFDGNSFETYSNQSDSNRYINGSLVQDIVEDSLGSILWVQTALSELCAIDLKTRKIIHRINIDQNSTPFTEVWGRCLHFSKNELWIGGLNTLSILDTKSRTYLKIDPEALKLQSSNQYNFSKILNDRLDRTWLLNEGIGIQVLDKSRSLIKSFGLNELGLNKKQKLLFWDAVSYQNDVYIASSWGVLHFDIGEIIDDEPLRLYDMPVPFSEREIRSLEIVKNSKLLLATSNATYGLNLIDGNIIRFENREMVYGSFSPVYEIFYDRITDLVWLGSQTGLSSFSLSNSIFSSYSKSRIGNQKIKHLYSLLPVSKNKIYGGGSDGIYQINLASHEINLLDTADTNLMIFRDKKSNVLASNSKGLFSILDNHVFPVSYTQFAPDQLERDHFNCAIQFDDSLVILSSINQKGLTVWNTARGKTTTFHSDSIDHSIPQLRSITYLFKSKNNKVFILTGESVFEFNPLNGSHLTHHIKKPNSNKRFTNFMDMCETSTSYFLGTYGDGLIELDKEFNLKEVYTTRNGLSNNCTYRLFNINEKKILMTTNNGLSILNLNTKKIVTYYEGDGLHGNGFEQLCGYQRGNKIYAGGPGGFTVINTDLLPETSPAPLLYPTGIHIDTQNGKIDSTHLFMSSFNIPNDAFKTTLNFVAPDYKNPQRMTYRYKIKELSNEWVDLGNQNFVDLIGINPGTYHFKVTATNSVGMDSEPLEIELNFLPKWYQTFWFKLLLLVAIVILIYLIQRYRLTQIRNQQRIRTEIANDLHDDIGSTLNSLKIFTHLAQYEPDNKGHLSQIEKSITNATVGLRDMIWVLEGEQDSVYDLVERIKKFAHPVCLADDIIFETKVDAESDLLISKKIKRNLLLIAKECINNSIKYAKCKHIKVILEYAKPNLKMTIMDDGKGFNLEEANMGKGLESIQYRARQIQFECKIETAKGQGTKTILVSK